MNKKILFFLALFSSLVFGSFSLSAADSASPYDTVFGFVKDTNSAVDAILDAGKEVSKIDSTKLADYFKSLSLWKKLSENSQNFITSNIGKVSKFAKKLGWIMNAVDLAPSVYNMVTSFRNRDKQKFKESFRDVTLKTVSILTGIGIGAAVTAAIPVVVAATAATGGGAAVVAAVGAVVAVGVGMAVDYGVKTLTSKTIEKFAGSLYDKMIGNDTLTSIGRSGGSGSGGKGGGDGPVTLDALKW